MDSADSIKAPSSTTLFINGRVLSKAGAGLDGQPTFADALVVSEGSIVALGSREDLVAKYQTDGVDVQDLGGKTVLPSFIDGHMHLLLLGQSLKKLSLDHCKTLDDILAALRAFAKAHPDVPRVLAKGWMNFMTPDGVDAAMLDEIDSRPIFIDSKDLHGAWCNSAALAELGVADMADPPGGKIQRDAEGRPSGVLTEGAVFTLIWPHLANVASQRERMDAIIAATNAYNAAGYTGVVEMAMDEAAWEAVLALFEERPDLPLRIVAYWLIKPAGTHADRLRQLNRAIELNAKYNQETSPDLRIAGIKIMCDGIVDACTAYLSEPYTTVDSPAPIWSRDDLKPIVQGASDAGLQIALHAIGDGAVRMAVDVLEAHTKPGSRHRIEHLEVVAPEEARRLGELGITASIQPVHADPAILRAWPRLLGKDRCGRAFAYRDFADAGALMAIGSDSPTAPYDPLHNIYIATTRRSTREPEYTEVVNEHFRLGVCEAVTAATAGAAKSVFIEGRTGSLEVGKSADLTVVDMQWDPATLLKARVKETWFKGKRVWRSDQ
ncbi:amidohydrolase 3 [Dactylonectria estremocensis]|uniref:Amidohydrolase 3 n=1 Tax=Dactylonectria estremocensis TaxID=1079267 RepID=A0A9P9DWL3_9HYPO|nr:amidohydrolase 3 [Dactylonectria estremocensis]